MKRSSAFLMTLLLASALLPAQSAGAAEEQTRDPVIAVINGVEVTNAEFRTFVQTRIGGGNKIKELTPQQLQGLMNEYISRELLYQDALRRSLDKSPEVVFALENQRKNIVSSYNVRQILENPPSEEEMKKIYVEHLAKPTKEYKTRHILVKSEDEAKQIISQLDQGAAFTELAKAHSIDSSSKEGGSLGWFSEKQMIPAFTEAAAALEPKTYTHTPVATKYGWHVILLENTRIIPPPPFESVKDQVRAELQNRIVGNYIRQLRSKSEISIK